MFFFLFNYSLDNIIKKFYNNLNNIFIHFINNIFLLIFNDFKFPDVLEEDKILNAANIFEIDAQVIKNRPLF